MCKVQYLHSNADADADMPMPRFPNGRKYRFQNWFYGEQQKRYTCSWFQLILTVFLIFTDLNKNIWLRTTDCVIFTKKMAEVHQ